LRDLSCSDRGGGGRKISELVAYVSENSAATVIKYVVVIKAYHFTELKLEYKKWLEKK